MRFRLAKLWSVSALLLSVAACSAVKSKPETPDEAYDRHMKAGMQAYEKGDTDEASTEFNAALVAARSFTGADPRAAAAMAALGDNHLKAHEYESAEGNYRQAEKMYIFLGYEHLDEIETLLRKQLDMVRPTGRRGDVERLYSRLIPFAERRGGPNSVEVARLLQARGNERVKLHRSDEAAADYVRAIEIFDVQGDAAGSQSARQSLILVYYSMRKCDEGSALLAKYPETASAAKNWSQSCRAQPPSRGPGRVLSTSPRAKVVPGAP